MTLAGCGLLAAAGPLPSLKKPEPGPRLVRHVEVHFHSIFYLGKPLCAPTVRTGCVIYFKIYTDWKLLRRRELGTISSSHCRRLFPRQTEPKVCDFTIAATRLPLGRHEFSMLGFYINGHGQTFAFTGGVIDGTVRRSPGWRKKH